MRRVLIVECQQEISSFNPVPSRYGDFGIHVGEALAEARRGTATYVGGALGIFATRADVEIVPVYGAVACSAGILERESFERLAKELLDALRDEARGGVDAVYFALHGAMAAEGELDPEGYILEQARRILGPDVPFVMSLDLHGIVTARMLEHCQAMTALHTYPHVDFADAGARAAKLLLRILDEGVRPVAARVWMPLLVRGNELITETGLYGGFIRRAQALEREPGVLAAAFFIGNPFTDVPELGCQSILVTDGDVDLAAKHALALADGFFDRREEMQQRLRDLGEAVEEAKRTEGTVIFTDAADAPSSGATGDSNVILRALLKSGYRGRILAPLTDPPTVEAAFRAGVGARQRFRLGGALDPRFTPLELEAEIQMLSNGRYVLETWGTPEEAGRTAVLTAGNVTLVVTSRPVNLFDRSLFLAHGQDPRRFDAVIVKSPHCQPQFFDAWAAKNLNVDCPGSTSANVRSLGHKICRRPMWPLDPDTRFELVIETFPARP
jgi:microcystin degradation protein MlrC